MLFFLEMKECMLKTVRIRAGLGTERFTTNRAECVNSLFKRETGGPLKINEFVSRAQELVERQERQIRWAIIKLFTGSEQPGPKTT